MARRECHFIEVADVPGRNDQAPRIWIAFDLRNDFGNLVDHTTIRRSPGTPLLAINRAEIALPVRPFVPERYTVFLEIADIGVALQEPQQFVDDGFHVAFLGGDQWKTFRK